MSCNCRSLCDHLDTSRDIFTSLNFGVFLFAFALFVVFTPLSYLSTGVESMTGSAVTMGEAFSLAADAVNGQVVAFVQSEVQVSESVGSVLAYTGDSVGTGLSNFVLKPDSFRESLNANVRSGLAMLVPLVARGY